METSHAVCHPGWPCMLSREEPRIPVVLLIVSRPLPGTKLISKTPLTDSYVEAAKYLNERTPDIRASALEIVDAFRGALRHLEAPQSRVIIRNDPCQPASTTV